jgi:hypothetical protein
MTADQLRALSGGGEAFTVYRAARIGGQLAGRRTSAMTTPIASQAATT